MAQDERWDRLPVCKHVLLLVEVNDAAFMRETACFRICFVALKLLAFLKFPRDRAALES